MAYVSDPGRLRIGHVVTDNDTGQSLRATGAQRLEEEAQRPRIATGPRSSSTSSGITIRSRKQRAMLVALYGLRSWAMASSSIPPAVQRVAEERRPSSSAGPRPRSKSKELLSISTNFVDSPERCVDCMIGPGDSHLTRNLSTDRLHEHPALKPQKVGTRVALHRTAGAAACPHRASLGAEAGVAANEV